MSPQPQLSHQPSVAKWCGVTRKMQSESQEHVLDLCHLLGQQTPAPADLNKAYQQLLTERETLENPSRIVLSKMLSYKKLNIMNIVIIYVWQGSI